MANILYEKWGGGVPWLEECCSEFNVLRNSTRVVMCNSILTPQQVNLVSKLDINVKNSTDVGGSYMGQDPPLLWTSKGLRLKKFRRQLQKLKVEPKEGDQVSSNFLENNPKIRRDGLEKKWFRKEKIAEEKKGPTSLAQTRPSPCTSKALEFNQRTPTSKRQIVETCPSWARWQCSKPPDDKDDDDAWSLSIAGKAHRFPHRMLAYSWTLELLRRASKAGSFYTRTQLPHIAVALKPPSQTSTFFASMSHSQKTMRWAVNSTKIRLPLSNSILLKTTSG